MGRDWPLMSRTRKLESILTGTLLIGRLGASKGNRLFDPNGVAPQLVVPTF
jgi:hypothetical protein